MADGETDGVLRADYRMDAPHPGLALDRGVQGLIGSGIARIESVAKVTGTATFAAEVRPARLAYGVAITATRATGRVTAIETSAARALPDVIDVVIDDPRIASESPVIRQERAPRFDRTLASYGMIVGIAVAESFEAAREAALAVVIRYADDAPAGAFDTLAAIDRATGPHPGAMLQDDVFGDVDAAIAAAEVTLDETYSTPRQVHAAIEPHAAVAEWHGDELELHGSIQIIKLAKAVLAGSLEVAPDRIRVRSPYIGGGFGGKIGGAEMVLAAIAAQRVGRPVKLQLTRQQLFHSVYGRSDTHQRMRLAASRDGRLTAIAQDSIVSQKHDVMFFEPVSLGAAALYAAPSRRFTTRIVRIDVVPGGAVRAPGEAVGMIALESAVDEMAERLGLDPIAFRRLNEPGVDPARGVAFSTRRLTDCFDEGARRFGWGARSPTPGTRRDGDWLIGMGTATAARVNFLAESEARVRLTAEGRAEVETDMTDIGTGTYTILAQIAAESLGLPIERVTVTLGDSDLPPGAGSGGSFGAASSGSSVALACDDIARTLATRMGAAPQDTTLKDGHVIAGNRRVPIGALVDGAPGHGPIEAIGVIRPGKTSRSVSQGSTGAQFAEVAVDRRTGEIRVRRMLGVFDCGRVLNARLARSQAIGGMIWGLGYALHEEAVTDQRSGAFVNRDLAEYHIPAHADVPRIEAYFIEEHDAHASPVGAKGLGELGISGAAAAVANAIYNACGVRIRDFPATLDKIIAQLPAGDGIADGR